MVVSLDVISPDVRYPDVAPLDVIPPHALSGRRIVDTETFTCLKADPSARNELVRFADAWTRWKRTQYERCKVCKERGGRGQA